MITLLDYVTGQILLGRFKEVVPTSNETGTTRTLSADDYGKKIRCTNTSGCAITIPAGIGENGRFFMIRRTGVAGPLTVTLGSGVTLDGGSRIILVDQGSECAFMAISENAYDFV